MFGQAAISTTASTLFYKLAQVFGLAHFHDDVLIVIALYKSMDLYYVRVLQLFENAYLLVEEINKGSLFDVLQIDDFNCHSFFSKIVDTFIDIAVGAFA